jgi:phosphoribosylaminoimidazole carboxylase (NCAIR synthetase)
VFLRYYSSSEWTRHELNALINREVGGERLVLPIWHNVMRAEVLRFSPMLAARLAATSVDSTETIVDKLASAMRGTAVR